MSLAVDVSRRRGPAGAPGRRDSSRGALVDWLPIAPEKFPVPKFHGPSLEGAGDRDLALPYPNLKAPVPNIDL
jgi:hypothetical protein